MSQTWEGEQRDYSPISVFLSSCNRIFIREHAYHKYRLYFPASLETPYRCMPQVGPVRCEQKCYMKLQIMPLERRNVSSLPLIPFSLAERATRWCIYHLGVRGWRQHTKFVRSMTQKESELLMPHRVEMVQELRLMRVCWGGERILTLKSLFWSPHTNLDKKPSGLTKAVFGLKKKDISPYEPKGERS